MHIQSYKIKAAISCNKNFSNSLNELKPFLSFDVIEIYPQTEPKTINSDYQVLITDISAYQKFIFEKINIPKILILKQNEKNTFKSKFELIVKLPINAFQFNRTVVDLSQKYKFDLNSLIKVKEYILDKNTRFLTKKDSSIKITEKEMNFIEELNNSTKPLTKNYILKNIWGYSSDADTHTIETHIYRLRQKIKNKFKDENFIKNTKDGYSF